MANVLTSKEQGVLRDLIQRLMRAPKSPGELTSEEARLLGDALTDFAQAFPFIADDVSAFVDFTSQVLAIHHIKTGGSGTWAQNADRLAAEVRQLISVKRVS